jgi:signal transduction histidine kinase
MLGKPRPLVTEWEEELLRIVQEALTNTLKHANASKFEVKLLFEADLPQQFPKRWAITV